jgi:hypothetical protein
MITQESRQEMQLNVRAITSPDIEKSPGFSGIAGKKPPPMAKVIIEGTYQPRQKVWRETNSLSATVMNRNRHIQVILKVLTNRRKVDMASNPDAFQMITISYTGEHQQLG